MAVITYKSFRGEVPRLDPHLLPDIAAQRALNCEFGDGTLSPMRGGAQVATVLSNPARGLYTEDGLNFFSWSVEAQVFNSPIIDDAYNRIYYLLPSEGTFRVTTRLGMDSTGPTPGQTWLVGVPRPTVAPVLSLVDRDSLPDYPVANVDVRTWWVLNGTRYGEFNVPFAEYTRFKSYSFGASTKPVGDEFVDAQLVAQFRMTDENGTEILSVEVPSGSTGSSNAVPGGIEVSLSSTQSEPDGNGIVLTNGAFTVSWGVVETRAYTYVNVNDWTEESAPAPATQISPTYIQDVQVVVAPTTFTGYRPFSKFKIYRTFGTVGTYLPPTVTATGSDGLTFLDSSSTPDPAGDALASADWVPPQVGLQGMVLMANGWFAAFKGNTLYMTEPFRPYAWAYSKTFAKNIRGLCPGQGGLVVTTADGVSIVPGANPVAASQLLLSTPQPGVAQRSMTMLDGAVAYASHDGIVLVLGGQASVTQSQTLFTRAAWRELMATILDDASMRFAYFDGALVGSSHTQAQGFVIRFDENAGDFVRTDERYDLTAMLPVADALFYTVGSQVYRYQGGDPKQLDWQGKDFIFPVPQTFAAGFIRCDGDVTLTLYADGVQRTEQVLAQADVVTNQGYFRLPDMNKRRRWSVRLRSTAPIYEFAVARTKKELQGE